MTQGSDSAKDSIPIGSIQWDSSWPELANRDEVDSLIGFMEERFGIGKEIFNDYLFFKKKSSWWLLRSSHKLTGFSTLKIEMAGIRAFQRIGNFIKPTTRFIQIFGNYARCSYIELKEHEFKTLIERGNLHYTAKNIHDGYIILKLDGKIIGLGLYLKGKIIPQLPKSFSLSRFCFS